MRTRTKALAVLMLCLAAADSTRGQKATLHLIGEKQGFAETGEQSTVTSYRVVDGKLSVEKVLIKPTGLITSVAQLDRYFFFYYYDLDRTTVDVLDTQTGVLSPPVVPGTDADPLMDYNYRSDGSVCANYPTYSTTTSWNEKTDRWSGPKPDLISVCTKPGSAPAVVKNQWHQTAAILWPGSYIGNPETSVIHLQCRLAVAPFGKEPPVVFATVPEALTRDLPKGIIDVVSANRRYLILRSARGKGDTLYVLDHQTSQWKAVDFSAPTFRIFGNFLIYYNQTCDDPTSNKLMIMTCIPSAASVLSLPDGKKTELPSTYDTEVLSLEADGAMLYREGTAIYKTHLGRELDRNKDLLVHDPEVKTIHWVY